MDRLREHSIRLATPRLVLRPIEERDWSNFLRWNQDPRVLITWNDGDMTPWKLEDLQRIYRGLSQTAHMFVAEQEGWPIGECWVQSLNLDEILSTRPGQRLVRIDLGIGEPELWGKGLGTEIVGALVRFAFLEEHADAIFACHVLRSNTGSRRVFEKNGFVEWDLAFDSGEHTSGLERHHLVLTREHWRREGDRPP